MFDPMTLLAAPFEAGALDWPDPRGLVVLRARPGGPFAPETLVCEQGFRPHHDALRAAGVEVAARIDPAPETLPAAAVVLSRNKTENRANFARAWAMTRPGGAVLAVGAKTDGIESLQKDVRRLVDLDGALPKSHGRVLWATRGADTPAVFAEWREEAEPAVRVDGRFVTAPGAFSWTEADPGSQLLAETLPPLTGVAADFGAGWGWLSDAVLASSPDLRRLDLWEAERVALDCAERNVRDPRAAFHWADVTGPDIPTGAYDWIVCNPPFHEGREVAIPLGEAFIAAAARALAPAGVLQLVANRTLPYERALGELFHETEELALTSRYKVLMARRPARKRR
jgi:16S rRNA (guanine1207-N2)-methyltransferase